MRVVFPEYQVEVTVEMNASELAKKILQALPVTGSVKTWGKEIYFEVPVNSPIEHPQDTVEFGDVAYWPQGACLCFFFGPTPASQSPQEIRPASPVEVIGRVLGEAKILETIPSGSRVEIHLQ